ncbi:MAG: dynamin family protein [Thermodesulforhabdaceae bacterium]
MEKQKQLVARIEEICRDIAVNDSNVKSLVSDLEMAMSEPLSIALVGPFSSGKTSVINALLERDLLPTGLNETTQTIVRLTTTQDGEEFISVSGARHPLEKIKDIDFAEKQIVEVKIITNLFPPGTVFIDTPGIKSVFFGKGNAGIRGFSKC